MINVGEQLVASYLRYIRECDFVETSIRTKPQGDIDVIGHNSEQRRLYICEVAVHVRTGLMYVDSKTNKTNNVDKLTEKLSKGIDHACKHYSQYEHHFMLWSPIVKKTIRGKPENSQVQHLEEIRANIKAQYGVDIECIVNEKFQKCLVELRDFAKKQTYALQCPLMRFMQIEEYLNKHIAKLD